MPIVVQEQVIAVNLKHATVAIIQDAALIKVNYKSCQAKYLAAFISGTFSDAPNYQALKRKKIRFKTIIFNQSPLL